ncbi:glyoxylase-like metal-dependent hydrolase (beta-lactamase superfamily II) [Cytobacillus eiseniae]|uniref:Glyoxylase-like metal-dependent hydrolase (Beta-lactamase superfamily II) n=1 Tax=Cytobacillus eiseniae TaxID=762947 RepID=A0ABS4RK59_9BACI|nr:MBL fold metallo-hydrolase [Cytobacillus eiseniae]MBP2243286.1 glyoxylase-like metal-dependent hydrolase (beta-lactamase superfamily II) [Cytobacillus eiseniae]
MQSLVKLSDRLYYLPSYQKTDRPILGAVVGDNYTLLIDAGNSTSHAKHFKEQLASSQVVGDLLALTHWHWDHVFGLREMNMPSIANAMTYDKMKELQELSWEDKQLDERVEAGIEIPFCADAIKLELGNNREVIIPDPTIIFEKQMKLNIGGVTCVIEHVGGDHSSDSNLIYLQEEKALFLGDCLYANMYAEKWHYTFEKMNKLLEKIEGYDANYFFLSHHPAPLTRDEFSSLVILLKTSAALTKKHKGKLEAITAEMTAHFGRELTEDDLEIIEYFVNGFEQA